MIVNIKKKYCLDISEKPSSHKQELKLSREHMDWTAKSAHAEINDKQCPAGADLFCAPANITKFFSLMLQFFGGKPIFSLGGWEDVNIGYVAEMLMCV